MRFCLLGRGRRRCGANLYVESVYRPPIVPTVRPVPNLGPFIVDVFEYPPTFLPLPRLLGLVSPDFWTFRRLWFALNLAGVAVGLVAIGRRLDTRLGTPAVWLTPFALAAPAVVGTLQAGNVQLLFIVIAAVAMLLFERRQHAAGGLLLGYAIASKPFWVCCCCSCCAPPGPAGPPGRRPPSARRSCS